MKEQTIQKINKIGKISNIVTLIVKILLGMGMGLLLVSYIMCMLIPKDSITMTMTENTVLEVDVEKFGKTFSDADREEIAAALANEEIQMELNGDEVDSENITVDGNVIHVENEEETLDVEFRQVANALLVLIIGLAMVMVTLFFVSALCKAIRDCSSPFEENVIVKMKRFTFALIPWLIGSSLIESVGSSLLAGKPMIDITIDMGMLVTVLVIFLLITIFNYGAILQQESDETL